MIGIICDYPQLSGTIIKDLNLKKEQSSNIFDIYINDDFVLINGKNGKIYACLTAQYLLDHFMPDHIINAGIITGFGSNVKIGDVIVGNHVVVKVEIPEEGQHLDYFKNEMICEPIDIKMKFKDFKVITGLCMADEKIVHDENLAEKYKDKIKAIDIQAFTVAAVCNIYGKNLIVIKGIMEKIEKLGQKEELKALKNTFEVIKTISSHLI